jgi:PPOX class probable F420-dependent enzyme
MENERTPIAERPRMGDDYGVSGSPDTMLSWQWVEEQLAAARNYWITTVRADGRPHAMPVWGVYDQGQIVFGTGPTSVKGRNLARDPRLVVHLESGDECVIAEGTARLVVDPERAARLAPGYQRKYDFDPLESFSQGFYVVDIDVVNAWLEKDFVNSAVRFRFE